MNVIQWLMATAKKTTKKVARKASARKTSTKKTTEKKATTNDTPTVQRGVRLGKATDGGVRV